MRFARLLPALALVVGLGETSWATPYPGPYQPDPYQGSPYAPGPSQAGPYQQPYQQGPYQEGPYEPGLSGNPWGQDPDYQVFHDELSPHGDWVREEPHGVVWRPHLSVVGPRFHPYATNGRWVSTEAGWSFASDWNWGWAVFHYGRWVPSARLGWVWVPGKVWGPSWCDWRITDGHVGWAPLPPGVSVEFGVASPAAWVFVPTTYFVQPDVYRYALPHYRTRQIYYRSSRIPTVRVFAGARYRVGPPPRIVGRFAGQPIRPVSIVPPRPGVVRRFGVSPLGVPRYYGSRAGQRPTYRGGPGFGSQTYQSRPSLQGRRWEQPGRRPMDQSPPRYQTPQRPGFQPGYQRQQPRPGIEQRQIPQGRQQQLIRPRQGGQSGYSPPPAAGRETPRYSSPPPRGGGQPGVSPRREPGQSPQTPRVDRSQPQLRQTPPADRSDRSPPPAARTPRAPREQGSAEPPAGNRRYRVPRK